MSGNNSTVNISPNITTTNCGVGVNCNDSQECFAAQEGPICDDNNKNTTYSWKLNTIVFPPIEYVGHNVGRKSKDHCEMFTYDSWSNENKSWLLTFFYQNWSNNTSNNNTFIELPSGSFIRPLDYIGSCSNIVETSSGISLQQLYCDYDSKCRKRINSLKSYCFSSNQCLSQLCGSYNITQPIDGNITFTVGSLCVNDGFLAYDHLRGYRAFNVKPVDDVSNDNSNNNNNNNNNNQDDNNKDSSGSMAVIIIILVILFTSMAIYGYARRLFKKRDNNDDDTHYLRREIDPETGQVITVNTPYTVMDEERPQSTSSNGGIVNSITQFFFPPGELPPPYVAVAENGSANYNNDVTLEEVREGVTIGGNNNNNNSIPTSRRTSLRSTTDDDTSRRDDDHDGDLGESSIISEVRPKEVTVDNSEGDKTEIGGSEVGGSRVGGIEDEKEEIEKEESEKEAAEKEESEKEAAVEKEESEKEVEKEEIEKEESEKGEIEKGESEKGESEKGESEKEESEKEKIDKSEVDKVEGEENVYYNSNT